jgi:POT family proton-dependent oligopeptide transporter
MEEQTETYVESEGKEKYPPQIKYIVGNEACERYSYYGMRSILTIFMVQYLLFKESDATSVYHLFVSACYLLPVFGAYVSDRFFGKYNTILWLSWVYCLGHLVLALFEDTAQGLYWGLGLIALGSGGIKPCVSAHVGDQFRKGQERLLNKVFDLFYWMINFGSFFSTLITPWMLKAYGPGWAFGIPGILMFIATIVFWMGKKHYVHVPPTGKQLHSTGPVMRSGIAGLFNGNGFWGNALKNHPQDAVDAVKSAFAVGKTFFAIMIFWALFDQHGSTWVLQAKQMDLHFMGMDLLPSQIAALNPIMVMVLIPIFGMFIYPTVEKMGVKITPLRKMGAGIFVSAASFVMAAAIQYLLDAGTQVNVAWQFFQYLTITGAEVMISITGLQFAYTQAPRSMKSTIMSMWLLTVFFGNIITAYVAQVNVFEGGHFYMFFAALTVVFGFIFIWIANNYEYKDYMES